MINYPFGKLELGEGLALTLNGMPLKGEPRLLRDLKPVLRNPAFVNDQNSGKVLYMMYRSVVADPMHSETFRMHSVRFDLTVMDYCLLDREPNKTLGHIHPEPCPVSLTPSCTRCSTGGRSTSSRGSSAEVRRCPISSSSKQVPGMRC